jgi:hypothetical protein
MDLLNHQDYCTTNQKADIRLGTRQAWRLAGELGERLEHQWVGTVELVH